MPHHCEQRYVQFPAMLLFEIVADIESYPEFLPWCIATHIHERTDSQLVADMIIGFSGIREKFSSRVNLNRPMMKINVSHEDGPFRYLNNKWNFIDTGQEQCRVDFFLEFELRSRPLTKLINFLFQNAVRQMVVAFETRARELHALDESSK